MNFLEFLPYHNRLIKFRYKGETLEGVVIDVIPYDIKKKESEYLFIPNDQLGKWKDPDSIKDDNIKKELRNSTTGIRIVDIEEIKEIKENPVILSNDVENNSEIFNDGFLNLPLVYNLEKNETSSFLKFFHDKLDEFKKKIDKINMPNEHLDSKKRINEIIKAVKQCIEDYYDGKTYSAYEEIVKIFPKLPFNFSKIKEEKTGGNFFRIRSDDSRSNFKPLELFHMPFERRNEIPTNRYSIPGFPCLYLSNSIYLAWEEMDRPKEDEMHTMLLKNMRNITYFDLTFDVYNDYEKFRKKTINEQLEFLALWPLIAACAVKVCNKDDVFKPEYIVPQLVLQWVRQEQKVDAIKYSTTRVDLTKNKGIFHNMVLPVKEIKDKDYCNELVNIFACSPVVSFELLKFSSKLPKEGTNPNSIDSEITKKFNVQQLEIIEGIPEDYYLTKFGQLEYFLNRDKK